MKKQWIPAVLLTLLCLIVLNGGYTLIVWGMAQLTPQKGNGERVVAPNGQRYYSNVAQKFSDDKYFWSRPSAVGYNAAGSGGSNKGPSNPAFLKDVSDRIDTTLAHNPGITRDRIPVEMVTASGSGLDPDISPDAAYMQVARVARARNFSPVQLRQLVDNQIDSSLSRIAPPKINVLRLNLALDAIKS
jgi:K+-transporting ATPase ATPase C chain